MLTKAILENFYKVLQNHKTDLPKTARIFYKCLLIGLIYSYF